MWSQKSEFCLTHGRDSGRLGLKPRGLRSPAVPCYPSVCRISPRVAIQSAYTQADTIICQSYDKVLIMTMLFNYLYWAFKQHFYILLFQHFHFNFLDIYSFSFILWDMVSCRFLNFAMLEDQPKRL